MVDAIKNNVTNVPTEAPDRSRKSTAPNVGLITPPNKNVKLLPDDIVKSNSVAKNLNSDKFDKETKSLDVSQRATTPIGVKIIFGLIAALAVGFGLKKFGSSLLHLFKSSK